MNKVLRKIYGDAIREERYSFPSAAPMYIKGGYEVSKLILDKNRCLLVKPKGADWNLARIKKHMDKIRDLCGENVVVDLDHMTALQRSNLIQSNVGFVSDGGQMFIPSWGSYFEEKLSRPAAVPEEMTANAQFALLYLCYTAQDYNEEMNLTQLAEKLNLPKSTCSRAVRQLGTLSLIKKVNRGTETLIRLDGVVNEVLSRALSHMTTPVKREVYLKKLPPRLKIKIGGIKALADRGMLAEQEDDGAVVIRREDYNKISSDALIGYPDFRDFGGVAVEVWKYDPFVLSGNKYVDDISLLLSLADNSDERVQKELDDIRGKYGIGD